MIPGVICATCIYFSPPPFQSRHAGQRPMGQCRRLAPLLDQSDGRLRTIWPLVNENQWCGEHSTIEGTE